MSLLGRESVWGAVEQARLALERVGQSSIRPGRNRQPRLRPAPFIPTTTRLSPTEERNPRSLVLDQLSIKAAVRLMITEDRRIPAALLREEQAISQAIGFIERSLRSGGRLFYVGAGTSGRLGVLDASECPPTFRTPPDLVQGIIAGGPAALHQAAEGAEDDSAAGWQAVACRGVTRRDVVVGIAASGRTPFVWGALHAARAQGAKTVLVCFNPHLRFARGTRPEVVIAPKIGPEILTGSTRLKAGTATKLILNLFTTITMVRLGKVVSNLMVDVNPSNVKLRERALRILRQLTGTDEATVRHILEQSGWAVKAALRQLAKTERPRHAPARRRSARNRKSAASAAR
jgi:N-acetylmuramic acid 6-phosphate etherase